MSPLVVLRLAPAATPTLRLHRSACLGKLATARAQGRPVLHAVDLNRLAREGAGSAACRACEPVFEYSGGSLMACAKLAARLGGPAPLRFEIIGSIAAADLFQTIFDVRDLGGVAAMDLGALRLIDRSAADQDLLFEILREIVPDWMITSPHPLVRAS